MVFCFESLVSLLYRPKITMEPINNYGSPSDELPQVTVSLGKLVILEICFMHSFRIGAEGTLSGSKLIILRPHSMLRGHVVET